MKALLIFLAVVGVMSVIAFFTYLADKIKAKKGAWRIKEAVLLALGFLGGATGALIAMNVFRHKTKHWYFWVVNVVSLLIHVAAGLWIYVKCV